MGGIAGDNFHHSHITGTAFVPVSVGQETVNGPAIVEPWEKGSQLSFVLLGGVLGTAASVLAVVEARTRGTSDWNPLKEDDGVTNLQFTPTLLDDTKQIENGRVLGTVYFQRINRSDIDAVRLAITQETAAVTALLACAYVISDLISHPSGETDDLFAKQFPA